MEVFTQASHYIKRQKSEQLCELLDANSELVTMKDRHERSLLHIACLFSNSRTVAHLIEHGADVHCKDKYGLTPLDRCFQYKPNKINTPKSIETVELLLLNGAELVGYYLFDLLKISLDNQALSECIFKGQFRTEFSLTDAEVLLLDEIGGREEYELIKRTQLPLSEPLIYDFVSMYNWDNGFELILWLVKSQHCSLIVLVRILSILCLEFSDLKKTLSDVPSYYRDAYKIARYAVKKYPELLQEFRVN